MIGSMVRLFLVLIFLAISLFNMKPIQFHFVVVFGITFLFFLFFDILEMRTNLRPDSEKPNKNSNV
jgi:threonine/homoserine/homoserine lactone efflux protein